MRHQYVEIKHCHIELFLAKCKAKNGASRCIHLCLHKFSAATAIRQNCALIARMNAERETPEYRSRTTRLAKWKELVTAAHEELQLKVGIPERIMFPGILDE